MIVHRIKTPAIERMIARRAIDSDGCWLWPGATNKLPPHQGGGGYGQIRVDGKTLMVHRVAFEHFVRPLLPGEVVDHECHRRDPICPGLACKHRRCWNPRDLQATTRGENSIAGVSPNMRAHRERVCARGHPLTDDNVDTWTRPSGTVRRACKTCAREGQRRRRAERS